uniref:RING-type E3 ubiquitin transferase n=1 Tax=Gallus gallus TaxID=9031 RepID=A0A8V0YLW2_CHICK
IERKGLVSLGLGAAKGTGMEGGEPSGLPGPKAAAPVSPQGDPLGGSPVPSLTISLGFLCFPPLSMRQAQALGTSLFSSPQDLGSEEPLEERGSAAMANRSHLQQEGPLEASDDYRCAICLDNISNMACVDPCFHRFCSGCIRRWATTRAVCPLCRQPIDPAGMKANSIPAKTRTVLSPHSIPSPACSGPTLSKTSKSPSDFLSFDKNTETAFP